jgi:hypothetical protein
MFKPLLHFIITSAIIMVACPAFAASVTYQLSVTIPPHAMPAASMAELQEPMVNNVAKITAQQVIQQEQITRNDQMVTVRSTVVL